MLLPQVRFLFKEAGGSPPWALPLPSCTSRFHVAVERLRAARVPVCAGAERSLCVPGWRRRAEVLGSASSVCVFEWTKWRRSPRLTKVSGLCLPTRDLGCQPAAVLPLGFRRLCVASPVVGEPARRGLLGSSAQASARVMASSSTPGPALCSAVCASEFSCCDLRASLEQLVPAVSRGGGRGREVPLVPWVLSLAVRRWKALNDGCRSRAAPSGVGSAQACYSRPPGHRHLQPTAGFCCGGSPAK